MAKKRFTADEIREIRTSPESARAVAKRFGVSSPTVLDIRHRRTYKHVPDLVDDSHQSPVFRDDMYLRMKALDFMESLPDGYCPTIVTSPPLGFGTWSQLMGDRAQIYVNWQRKVITECRRIAGPEGIFVYHWVSEYPYADAMLIELRGLQEQGIHWPSRRGWVITLNHHPPASHDSPVASGHSWTERPAEKQSALFVFPGAEWSMPEGTSASQWDDVWDIPIVYAAYESEHQDMPNRLFLSDELADKSIAFGQGRVFDPFANTGAIPLAAIRAGRPWLACDMRTDLMAVFESRRVLRENSL